MNKDLQIIKLGKKDFSSFYKLNNRMYLQRVANDTNDSLTFVEHPHVIIIGNKGDEKDVTVPNAMARREEIPLFQVDWEGDTTYRGPGQLIIYPVIHTHRQGLTVQDVQQKMEKIFIQLLHQYGIKAHTFPQGGGIGVDGHKIAFIDLEVRQNVTRFSMALNINPRLSVLRMLQLETENRENYTSMYTILKKKVDVEQLRSRFTDHFQKEFGYKMIKSI